MRSGCISLGNVQCEDCHSIIPYPERYLVEETDGATLRLCVDGSLKRVCAGNNSVKGRS